MTYESWRCTYQDSEQAVREVWIDTGRLRSVADEFQLRS